MIKQAPCLGLVVGALASEPACAQQNLPLGSTNTLGTVGNANAGTGTASTGSAVGSVPSASRTILLPSGRRATISGATVVVCDAPGAPFPDEVDVCSVR